MRIFTHAIKCDILDDPDAAGEVIQHICFDIIFLYIGIYYLGTFILYKIYIMLPIKIHIITHNLIWI